MATNKAVLKQAALIASSLEPHIPVKMARACALAVVKADLQLERVRERGQALISEITRALHAEGLHRPTEIQEKLKLLQRIYRYERRASANLFKALDAISSNFP